MHGALWRGSSKICQSCLKTQMDEISSRLCMTSVDECMQARIKRACSLYLTRRLCTQFVYYFVLQNLRHPIFSDQKTKIQGSAIAYQCPISDLLVRPIRRYLNKRAWFNSTFMDGLVTSGQISCFFKALLHML